MDKASKQAAPTNRTFTARSDEDALRKAKRFIRDGGFTYQSFHLVREGVTNDDV